MLIEDHGLVIKVDLSAILNSFDSNQFMLYPLGYVILSKVVPCPLPFCFTATEPTCCQLLKPMCLEPVLCNKRSHLNEKPKHQSEEQILLATARKSQQHKATKTRCSQIITQKMQSRKKE